MKIRILGSLGDDIALTALIREYKKRNPKEMVRVLRPGNPEVYKNNPHLNIGRLENGERCSLVPWKNDAANIPASIAKQMNLEMDSTQPEIFLTDEEKSRAMKELDGVPRPIVTIDPRSSMMARTWPQGRFQKVVDLLRGDGWSVVEVGKNGSKEPYYGGDLPPLKRTWMEFVDQQNLRQVFATIWASDLFIGNDSGLSHAAAAVDTPSVVVFSVSPPSARAYDTTVEVWSGEHCHPGCQWICARPNRNRDWCMLKIDPEAVMSAVDKAVEKFKIERRRRG